MYSVLLAIAGLAVLGALFPILRLVQPRKPELREAARQYAVALKDQEKVREETEGAVSLEGASESQLSVVEQGELSESPKE